MHILVHHYTPYLRNNVMLYHLIIIFFSNNHAHTIGWAQIMLDCRKNISLAYNNLYKISQNQFQLFFQRTLFGHYSNGVFEGVKTNTPFE